MDNQRLLIWAFFGLMGWITYQTWMQDYAPPPGATPATTVQVESLEQSGPGDATSEPGELPALAVPAAEAAAPSAGDRATDAGPAPAAPAIHVTTDVLDLEISTQGATLQSARLFAYPVAKDQPDTLVQLLNTDDAHFGVIQTGLRAAGGGEEPNHRAMFQSDRDTYAMGNADELLVPLRWQSADGVIVEKRFRFKRGQYAFVVEQEITNGSHADWRGASYAQIQRFLKPRKRTMFDVDSYSFSGPIIYDGEKSQKLKLKALKEDGAVQLKTSDGWVAEIQHHFLSAIVPEAGAEQSYKVFVRGDRSTASAIGATETVAPGASKVFTLTAFIGPKLQSQLEQIDKTLKLTVDYGWLTIISEPLFWLLSRVDRLFGNWGVSIILVTFLIKLAFYKLTESSGRSMAKMRNLQPRMKAMQDRYKDDKQALSAAMMDLYKREKVNPAAGCLPILIQMPFFLAFYWVLLESVEMRQAPFALWITDLSTRDPYFILPLIMGAAMFGQQKLNPAPADPMQAKVMQIMPIMFTAFFAFFPSGLVLYWVTNTLLSIAQQWNVNKVVAREAEEKKH